MTHWYDPRESWLPLASVFVLALLFVVDLSRPAGVLDSGLWIPVLYAVVPVVIGLLAYVRRRATTGRGVPLGAVVALTVWGLIGAVAALVVALVVGLGRPTPPGPPSAAFGLLTGLLTYLVPAVAFGAMYGEAGRSSRRRAAVLAAATPVVATAVLAVLVRSSW